MVVNAVACKTVFAIRENGFAAGEEAAELAKRRQSTHPSVSQEVGYEYHLANRSTSHRQAGGEGSFGGYQDR
jgi:hypothetical protein